jgi:uncharacterized protein (DUF305 family)
MNHKIRIYSFIGLLTSSMISGLLITNNTQAQSPNPDHNFHHPSNQNNSAQKRMMAQPDQHFIEMMIPHHQGAIEMSDLALSRAKHPEIKKLAIAIQENQAREIQQMRTWYKTWYGKEVPPAPAMNHQGMMPSKEGMDNSMMSTHHPMGGMKMDLAALKNAPDFDKEFLRQMIPHHQMAIMMSQKISRVAKKSEIRNLAQSIIKSQSAEIKEMKQWKQTWYPSKMGKF